MADGGRLLSQLDRRNILGAQQLSEGIGHARLASRFDDLLHFVTGAEHKGYLNFLYLSAGHHHCLPGVLVGTADKK